MGRLADGVNVVVLDESGNPVLLEAGQEVPAEYADQVGEHCLVGGDSDGGDAQTGPPPKGGPGSGQEAWLAYARTFDDVEVADNATREDIQTALTDAGHPVESE